MLAYAPMLPHLLCSKFCQHNSPRPKKYLLPTSTTGYGSSLCITSFLQTEIYIEDGVTHNTVQEGMEDKSQPQTETGRKVRTNREAQTTGEGQLL